MSFLFSLKSIIDADKHKKRKSLFKLINLKRLLVDKIITRKMIAMIIATGICAIITFWLTSKSSLGADYYTNEGLLLSIIMSLFLAPSILNYAIESAKVHSAGWSYIIGAKAGSCFGILISLVVGVCSIIFNARWILDKLHTALAALVLILMSGIVVGAIIGMLLLPILRLAVYGSRIIDNKSVKMNILKKKE